MPRVVKCVYCGVKFDRDKEEYCQVSSRRYSHASCMLREADKDPNYKKLEIIDPTDEVICIYCKKPLSKKDSDCVQVHNGKYAHQACVDIEKNREKTDKEKLEDYIKELFQISYIEPRVRAQINKYVEEFNYTYSGMHKALYYFYEIKGGDKEKAHGSIGIIPYVYRDSYNYYYNLWLAKQKNKDINIQNYTPKIKEVVIPPPKRKERKRSLFTFLDEEQEK